MTTVANLIHTISLHQSDVNWVAYSGKTLATCSGDKTVRLWSTEDFTEYPCSPLCGHGYYVHCCVFSPFGTMLASCSTDGKVILWDSKTGEKKGTFEHPSKSGIRVCRFSPNSSWLVTGSDDETLVIWDMKTKKLHRTLVGHTAYVNAVAYTPCSGFLVSGSSNGDLRAWDAEFGHGPCLWYELEGHDLGVMCCEFSPTFGAGSTLSSTGEVQYLLATCGNDNLVKLWNFRARFGTTDVSLTLRDTLAGHRETVMAVCFSSSGNMLASGSGDKTVRLWDPLKGEPLHTIEGHSRYVTCCAFSGDGKFLASGSNDKTVKIWKITSEEELTDTATYVDLLGSEEVLAQNKKPIEQWTVENVVTWVQELGLDQYADRFRKHAIDGTELAVLTQETLEKDLEIDALGHRNKILRAVKQVMAHPIIQEKAASESDVPDEYLCPITREVMKEPVMASDGYTYERSAITAWVNSGKTSSPMTNATLPNMTLLPNRNMKMLIQRYLQERKT